MSHITVEVPPLSRQAIRDYTNRLRNHLNWKKPYFPIVEVLELALYKLEDDYEFLVEDVDEMGTDHGRTYPDQKVITVRLDVYEGACAGKGRDRMTLAHELGHFLMHRQLPLTRRVERETIPSYKSSEWQANCFGGELLMSANHVHNCEDSYDASELFGVSIEAANYQWGIFVKDKII